MKKKIGKVLLNGLFFIAVFTLTVWAVFRGENLDQILKYLYDANWWYLIPAVACVVCFILGESVVIHYLMKQLGSKVKFFHCCLYSFIGFFYSAITPSASGGQPMQVVAMKKDGLSATVSTVVLAIVTITYKLVLVFLGLVILIIRPEAIMVYLDPVESVVYLGLILNVVFVALLLTAVFYPDGIRRLTDRIFTLLSRFHTFRNPEKVYEKVEDVLDQYHGTSAFFRAHPIIIFRVFLITLAQRLFYFLVIWFTYLAFDLTGHTMLVLVMLYAMISVAVDMLPLPGGMGISETLFLSIFEPIFGEALVIPGMVICRGISYYTQLVISAVMTAFAQIFFHFRRQK